MTATNSNSVPSKGFVLGEGLYSVGKWLAMVLIPALSTLYFTMGSVWELPNVTKVVGSLAALDTFLGVILGISTKSYNSSDAKYDGAINVTTTAEGKTIANLDLNVVDPNDILKSKEVTFKVNPQS